MYSILPMEGDKKATAKGVSNAYLDILHYRIRINFDCQPIPNGKKNIIFPSIGIVQNSCNALNKYNNYVILEVFYWSFKSLTQPFMG